MFFKVIEILKLENVLEACHYFIKERNKAWNVYGEGMGHGDGSSTLLGK